MVLLPKTERPRTSIATRAKKLSGLRNRKHPKKGPDKTCKTTAKIDPVKRERLIRKTVYFNGHRMKAMIDSGANSSYISEAAIKKYKITTQPKDTPYTVSTVEGEDIIRNDGWITHQTTTERLKTGTHIEEISFNIIYIKDDILLDKA